MNRDDLNSLLDELRRKVERPGRLFLIADTSQLLGDLCDRVARFWLASDGEAQWRREVERVANESANRSGHPVVWEAPGDVIPLPDGYQDRHRKTSLAWDAEGGCFEVLHFDPYSVTCRLLARGDEPDYRTALRYLRHGWVAADELTGLVEQLMPRFTAQTIQQDPAEFRRKFKGLMQMWRAEQNGGSSR